MTLAKFGEMIVKIGPRIIQGSCVPSYEVEYPDGTERAMTAAQIKRAIKRGRRPQKGNRP